VLSISIFYELCLVFILFQNKNTVRAFLNTIDSSVGMPLIEKSYALDDCNDFSFDNLVAQIDWFVLAHALGWFCKALVLRDYWFCWFNSIAFELMEYTLAHQLPKYLLFFANSILVSTNAGGIIGF
jgi:phosphatidylserine synthase 2